MNKNRTKGPPLCRIIVQVSWCWYYTRHSTCLTYGASSCACKCHNASQGCLSCACWRACHNKVVSLPSLTTTRGILYHFVRVVSWPHPWTPFWVATRSRHSSTATQGQRRRRTCNTEAPYYMIRSGRSGNSVGGTAAIESTWGYIYSLKRTKPFKFTLFPSTLVCT